MKELMIEALKEAFDKLEKQVPKTKKVTRTSSSILGMPILELPRFVKDNNIPEDAIFDGVPNQYDGLEDLVLSWEIEVPTTDAEKLDYKRTRFKDMAWRFVYHKLLDNGYKRISNFSSSSLKPFKDLNHYDLFVENNFDILLEYYKIYFTKNVLESKEE